jgi:Icc-related predicted phosphoesterase
VGWNIVAVSDLHGTLPDIPVCDLLLIAGDVCPVTNHDLQFQVQWLLGDFRRWLKDLPARKIVMVAGNHDFAFERYPPFLPADFPATYLQDSGTHWEGLRIWGTPWQPWFFDWAFNLREPELEKKWALIPAGTDIVVVHGPPRGYGDGVPERGGIRSTGSPSLLTRIELVAPRLVVFGHIHEGRGEWRIGRTVMANVTVLDEKYQNVHAPWKFYLDGALAP